MSEFIITVSNGAVSYEAQLYHHYVSDSVFHWELNSICSIRYSAVMLFDETMFWLC